MLRSIANSIYVRNPCYDVEDLVQIGSLSLLRVCKVFDESRGLKMSTLLFLSARRDMIQFIKKNSRSHSNIKSIISITPEDYTEHFSKLSEEESNIIDMLAQGHNKKEVASILNVDYSVFRNRLNKMYKKIRTANA